MQGEELKSNTKENKRNQRQIIESCQFYLEQCFLNLFDVAAHFSPRL